MNQQKLGIGMALFKNIFSGAMPVIIALNLSHLPTLFVSGFCTLMAGLVFLILLIPKGYPSKARFQKGIKNLLIGSFLTGVVVMGLVFWAATLTSPTNVSIILLSQTFFAFLLLTITGKEVFCFQKFVGAILLAMGAIFVLYAGNFRFQIGDIVMVLASFTAPIGNYFQKKSREVFSSLEIMTFRSFLSAIILLFAAFLTAPLPKPIEIYYSFGSLLFVGLLCMGFCKILFFEALARLQVSTVNALSATNAAFTMTYAYFLLNEMPTKWQVFGVIPICLGVWVMFRASNKSKQNTEKV